MLKAEILSYIVIISNFDLLAGRQHGEGPGDRAPRVCFPKKSKHAPIKVENKNSAFHRALKQ